MHRSFIGVGQNMQIRIRIRVVLQEMGVMGLCWDFPYLATNQEDLIRIIIAIDKRTACVLVVGIGKNTKNTKPLTKPSKNSSKS